MSAVAPSGNQPSRRQLIRWVLVAFLLTFVMARVLVLLIMSRRLPDLYFYVGGTHVHHLNFGIFALVAAGAIALFMRPRGRQLTATAVLYGIGLALTFDEFGMWLHLGGGYWQRASFDAMIVIGGALVLLAYTPPFWRWSRQRWLGGVGLMATIGVFLWLLLTTAHHVEDRVEPRLERLERAAPQ
jgi:hypothetical protein